LCRPFGFFVFVIAEGGGRGSGRVGRGPTPSGKGGGGGGEGVRPVLCVYTADSCAGVDTAFCKNAKLSTLVLLKWF
jgi:hypothetical protein